MSAEAKARSKANQQAYYDSLKVEGLSPPQLAIVVGVVTYRRLNPAKWGVHPDELAGMQGRKNSTGGWRQSFAELEKQGWLQRRTVAVNASCPKASIFVFAPTPKAIALCYPSD